MVDLLIVDTYHLHEADLAALIPIYDLAVADTYHLHEAGLVTVIHNYLTRYSTGVKDSVALALEALETQLETVDNAKVIRAVDIVLTRRDREQCIGFALYDT